MALTTVRPIWIMWGQPSISGNQTSQGEHLQFVPTQTSFASWIQLHFPALVSAAEHLKQYCIRNQLFCVWCPSQVLAVHLNCIARFLLKFFIFSHHGTTQVSMCLVLYESYLHTYWDGSVLLNNGNTVHWKSFSTMLFISTKAKFCAVEHKQSLKCVVLLHYSWSVDLGYCLPVLSILELVPVQQWPLESGPQIEWNSNHWWGHMV